jgi:hypothetical protein
VGLLEGLGDLRVAAALPLGLAQLVAEQAAPDRDAIQVTGGRQLLDLVLEQDRLALGMTRVLLRNDARRRRRWCG